MNNFIKIFLLLFSLCFYGCDYFCTETQINPAFIGFNVTDIDTIILRAYKPNENFLNLIDTLLISNKGNGNYTTSNDTTIVFINDGRPHSSILSGVDWEVYIPAKNKTIHFSNIITTPGPNKHGCQNPIISFLQDNGQITSPVLYITDQFWTSGYRAYIHQ